MTANLTVGSRDKQVRKNDPCIAQCVPHSFWDKFVPPVKSSLGHLTLLEGFGCLASVPFSKPSDSLSQVAACCRRQLLYQAVTPGGEKTCKQIPCAWSSNLDQSLQSLVTSIMILSPPFPSPQHERWVVVWNESPSCDGKPSRLAAKNIYILVWLWWILSLFICNCPATAAVPFSLSLFLL